MSPESVEIVRRAYERFNGGDIEGFLELCRPELEYRDLPDLPGSGLFMGHDEMRGWWEQLYDAFDDLRFGADEFLDAGDRVLVVNRASGRGKGSRATVEMRFSNVWTIVDGEIASIITYSDHAEALEAARLSS